MATYDPVTPDPGQWASVPTAAVDRLAVAFGGPLWISDDASPNVAQAIPLLEGASFFVAANRAVRVMQAATGASLRLMDY